MAITWTTKCGTWTNPAGKSRGTDVVAARRVTDITTKNIAAQVAVNAASGDAGLIFRYSKPNGVASFYRLILRFATKAGQLKIEKVLSGADPVIVKERDVNIEHSHDYELRVVAAENCFIVFLDGKYEFTCWDSSLAEGVCGLEVLAGTADFDDFKEWDIPDSKDL